MHTHNYSGLRTEVLESKVQLRHISYDLGQMTLPLSLSFFINKMGLKVVLAA